MNNNGEAQKAAARATAAGIETDSIRRCPSRVGSMWQLEATDGTAYFLKVADGHAGNAQQACVQRAESIRREVVILQAAPLLCPDLFVAGSTQDPPWILTRYLGPRLTASAPNRKHARAHWAARTACEVLEEAARIFQLGWLHGDVQPAHFVRGPKGVVRLLDFELARHKNEENVPYAGALVHYCAPEIAAGMLAGDNHIPYRPESEVYALGATLFFLFTGLTVHILPDVSHETRFRARLETIVKGNRNSDIPAAMPDGFAWAGSVLQAGLDPCQEKRPPDPRVFCTIFTQAARQNLSEPIL